MDLFGEEPKPVRETWKDFKPNDDDRAYCVERWGLLYLADVFAPEVIEHYQTEGSKRVKNKHLALTRWIQRASPSGRYYEVGPWERMCEQARRYKPSGQSPLVGRPIQSSESPCEVGHDHGGNRRSTFVPASRETHESHMKHVRDILGK